MDGELGCGVQYLPFVYLGVPIGGNARKLKFWELVLKKIESKLAIWKCKLLSTSGRAQLIKSILNNLPIYFLSMFRIPDIVAKKIIYLERKFFVVLWMIDGN